MFSTPLPDQSNGDERKDLFGPVADLMVGVIFIFILLLIGLALHLQPEDFQRLRDRVAQLEAELEASQTENTHLRERVTQLEIELAKSQAENVQLAQDNKRLKDFVRFVREHHISDLFSRIAAANETRAHLLEDLRQRLNLLGVVVTIDPTNGTLKLPAGGLFHVGQAEPTLQGQETLRHLAEVLVQTLPCYSHRPEGMPAPLDCPRLNHFSALNSVYVEGHTDVAQFAGGAGRFRDNWDLSAARAIATYKLLQETQPLLRDLKNQDKDALLGVSGYAESRPATRATGMEDRMNEAVRDLDRRIEIRLTMTADEAAVQQSLKGLNQQLKTIHDLTE